jgi:hypothetical protein
MKIKPDLSPLTDPDFFQLRETEKWNEFEDELITGFNAVTDNSIKDTEYAKKLYRLLCRDQYALMFDRMRMNQNLSQKYGTHFILDNRASGKNILYPLEDETKVDEWRKEIGLEPLDDYLRKMNIQNIPAGKN